MVTNPIILEPNAPIGVFDSGLGGLTVLHALQDVLPQEQFIYYGDTVNFPFGEKPVEFIREYCFAIVRYFLARGCKLIVIACNSASVAAYHLLEAEFGQWCKFVDMVEPLVLSLESRYNGQRIGLIGTTQTIQSNDYNNRLKNRRSQVCLQALATPLLAPAIENQLSDDTIMHLLYDYLNHSQLSDVAALILGCTHYPLIRDLFELHYQGQDVEIIDPSDWVANHAKNLLSCHGLLRHTNTAPVHEYYVSQLNPTFETKIRELFDGKQPFQTQLLTQ
jgi:glutamate racemase